LYFNSLIEKLFYQPALRDRLGLFGTARIYTVPAWLLNLVYTRMRPAGSLIRTLAVASIMAALRMAAWLMFQVGLRLLPLSATRSSQNADSPKEPAYAM